MKILITGANGFVGTWFAREASKYGHEIIAVIKDKQENISSIRSLQNLHIVYCDMANFRELPSIINQEVDCFYHLAWKGTSGLMRTDYEVQLQNVKYAIDSIYTAKELHCKKILFAGTISERIAENMLEMNTSAENLIYGVAKSAAHRMIKVICSKAEIDYVWMQFANIYGPLNNTGNIIGYTLERLLNGNVAEFGPANTPYDFIYIKDLVKAMRLMGENVTKEHYYYLGSGDVRTLSEYLFDVGTICCKKEMVKIGIRPDDGLRYQKSWFDNSKLKKEFGFVPDYTFQEGIRDIINQIKNK